MALHWLAANLEAGLADCTVKARYCTLVVLDFEICLLAYKLKSLRFWERNACIKPLCSSGQAQTQGYARLVVFNSIGSYMRYRNPNAAYAQTHALR